ncbi:MAG: polyhydroxyalkanoate synthesis repressor PhaR [Acidobacteriota bacterium]|nr:polyhydroxyalkanoate synthesis repressor PhaR [Blastocatellia bacterium]MDW8413666.1 polyhydroxyalkanoate synthesis repressor PhaR [Acidobacteriota bacterium]
MGKVVIKRYGNRRLYNTETSRHITMGQLVELIRSGRDCVVIDSKTNEDITKLILVQIILEEEKSGKNLLPVEFLYQLIRNREESFHDFFYNYMTASFEAYLKARSEFERRFKSWLELAAPQMWEKIFPMPEAARRLWGIKDED